MGSDESTARKCDNAIDKLLELGGNMLRPESRCDRNSVIRLAVLKPKLFEYRGNDLITGRQNSPLLWFLPIVFELDLIFANNSFDVQLLHVTVQSSLDRFCDSLGKILGFCTVREHGCYIARQQASNKSRQRRPNAAHKQ